MLDIGFQNLSRLFASGKPLRVLVLDTQVYSNTGGQACTSGFTGQIADMSAWGAAQHGKQETRKELALLAIAHRGVYVHQSSQASASHLIGGVLRGLNRRRPALFNIYTPCPVEHGLPDEWAPRAARLALESRAFPFLTFDPDAGPSFADALSLDGNPDIDALWPVRELEYTADDGTTQKMELPLTIADWAATETRFRKHFTEVPGDADTDDHVLFHEFVALGADERAGRTPFIHALGRDGRLRRLRVGDEIVRLAEDRLEFWNQLRELAGLRLPESVRERVSGDAERAFEQRLAAVTADFDAKLAELRAAYPAVVARRLAEGLLRAGEGRTIGEILAAAELLPTAGDGGGAAESRLLGALVAAGGAAGTLAPPSTNGGHDTSAGASGNGAGTGAAAAALAPEAAGAAAGNATATATATAAETAPKPAAASDDDALEMEAYIETERCTSCNECTNLNNRLFAYDANKQAYIKDIRAGTFQELVRAAELCPAAIIHPGTPLNPAEKDLAKWVARAERFN
jgi:pyruvate-ferredoxin/flavodoxin oxidoreductase